VLRHRIQGNFGSIVLRAEKVNSSSVSVEIKIDSNTDSNKLFSETCVILRKEEWGVVSGYFSKICAHKMYKEVNVIGQGYIMKNFVI